MKLIRLQKQEIETRLLLKREDYAGNLACLLVHHWLVMADGTEPSTVNLMQERHENLEVEKSAV